MIRMVNRNGCGNEIKNIKEIKWRICENKKNVFHKQCYYNVTVHKMSSGTCTTNTPMLKLVNERRGICKRVNEWINGCDSKSHLYRNDNYNWHWLFQYETWWIVEWISLVEMKMRFCFSANVYLFTSWIGFGNWIVLLI